MRGWRRVSGVGGRAAVTHKERKREKETERERLQRFLFYHSCEKKSDVLNEPES